MMPKIIPENKDTSNAEISAILRFGEKNSINPPPPEDSKKIHSHRLRNHLEKNFST